MSRFTTKTAIVTGASRGIGPAIAIAIAIAIAERLIAGGVA